MNGNRMSAQNVPANRVPFEPGTRSAGGGMTRDQPFNALLLDVRTRLDERLSLWLRPRLESAAQISVDVGTVAAAIAELVLRGGKRMRAALVAAGFEAFAVPGQH